jgi:hypothetical protein
VVGTEWSRLPTTQKVVALTFDAGNNDDGVASILATLRATVMDALMSESRSLTCVNGDGSCGGLLLDTVAPPAALRLTGQLVRRGRRKRWEKSLALASLFVSGGKPNLSSSVFSTEVWSYTV